MSNKRIAFFLGSMGRGGAERVISILSNEYALSGLDTDICLLLENKVDYRLDASTRIHDFTGREQSRLKRIPYWLSSIRSYVKEEQPDMIVSFVARINLLVMLACFGLGKKIVISERNDPKHDGRGWATRLMTRLFYPHASAVVFQTRRVQSYFSPSIQAKSVVVPNPISVTCTADDRDENKIVTVGRLALQKNQKMLIEAFADIGKSFPEKQLYIYGEGELKDSLKAHACSLGVGERVHFMGNVQNVHEQIADAAFFVLPSDYEGLSNALLEAMMMGLPCISTDCAGSDEYIEDGISGLLIPVGDREALKKAMLRFITDEELRSQCGKRAQEASGRFCAETVLKKWHEVIDQ